MFDKKQIPNELPFEEIKQADIASRNDVRKMKESITLARETYQIKTDKIEVRGAFNRRRIYKNIDKLADLIDANGIVTPLVVDVLKDGTIFVERGHRRLKALELLRERYNKDGRGVDFEKRFGTVECFVNNTKTTEFDRIKGLYTSNHIEAFTPVENSDTVILLKTSYNMTHQEIADELGIARQSVDNYVKIAALPDHIKQSLVDETMSLNEALRLAKRLKDDEKRVDDQQQNTTAKGTNANNAAPQVQQEPRIQNDPAEEPLPGDAEENQQDQQEQEKKNMGTTTASEEVEDLNSCLQMVDKLTVYIDGLKESNPQLVADANILTGAVQKRIEKVRDYLIKTQK